MYQPKLVFLIPRLGIVDRGAEIFVYELVKRLQQEFSVSVYVRWSSRTSPLISELQDRGVEVIRLQTPGAPDYWTHVLEKHERIWKIFLKLHITPAEVEMLIFSIVSLPLLLSRKCDLLFPVNGVWGAFICRFIRRIRGTPFVYSSQGGIEPMIARQKPDIYFVFNQKTLNWYRKYFPWLNLVNLPMGIDIKRFSPEGKKVRLSLPRPIIMVTAALIAAKNVDKTILAVAQLEVGSLIILGNGPLKSRLESLADKVLSGRYLFTSCANSEIPSYYRAADIFTFAAEGEEFGLVYLEALASGLAVVGNREEHLIRLIGSAGVMCDVDDIRAYSRALTIGLRKKWSTIPRRQALKYTWEIVAERYKKELLEVVRKH